MLTTTLQWREWHKKCAVALCVAATRDALQRFAWLRFGYNLERYLGARSRAVLPPGRDCFHLLETHCRIGRGRHGKRYKDWLAARGTDRCAWESGVSLLLRDVVRAYIRRDCPLPGHVSIDAPLQGLGELTMADLLPAATTTTSMFLEEEVEAVATTVLATLKKTHKLVVLARGGGISLADPKLLRRLRLSKSRSFDLWREVFKRVGTACLEKFPQNERQEGLLLALEVAKKLQKKIILQEKVEKRWFAFLKGVEGLYNDKT